MRTWRWLRFLVLWILLTPVVMATSDTLDHAASGAFSRIPDLREGDRFVYDVVLTSEFRDLEVRVPSYFIVEVGEVERWSLGDREVDALPVTTIKGWGPWDEYASLRGVITTARGHWETTRTTAWFEVSSGGVLRFEEHGEGAGILPEDDQPVEYVRTQVHHGSGDGRLSLFRWGMEPGQRIASPIDGVMAALGQLVQVEVPRAESGMLDGVPVKNVKTWGREPAGLSQGDHGACSLYYPELSYQDFGLSGQISDRPVWTQEQSDVWVSPVHAFPVLQECRLTIRQLDADGPLVEDLHFAMVLQEYKQGGAKVRIPYDAERSVRTQGFLEAHDAVHPGVPEPEGGFPFPLLDAYQKARESEELSGMLDLTEAGPVVQEALFERVWHEAPDPVLPAEADGLLRELMGGDPEGDEVVATEKWSLTLVDEQGEWAQVVVVADLDGEGEVVESRVESVHERGGHRFQSLMAHRNAPIVPLERLVRHHEERTGESVEAFSLHWSHRDEAYRLAVPNTLDRSPTPNGVEYSAEHGAVLAEWTLEQTPRDRPVANPYQQAAVSMDFVPQVDLSMAAILSGAFMTFLFLVTFFWDMIVRAATHGALSLYAKVQREKALDHPRRREIHMLVSEEPGVIVKEVRSRLKLAHGTAMFHLATLEHVGLLSSQKVGRERAWFVPGQVHHREQARATLLNRKAVLRVFEAVAEYPGIHQRALAQRLGVQAASVRSHLKRLEAAGLVRAVKQGRQTTYVVEAAPLAPETASQAHAAA